AFLSFDWSDARWREHLNGLYPPPSQDLIAKFKKKWYKKQVDPDFDVSYEPPPAASSSSSAPPGQLPPLPKGIYSDGSRWAVVGQKATICFGAYAVAMVMCVGSFAGVFPPYQSLVILVGSFLLEILAKYGFKLKKEYMQAVLLDDIGIMPIMAFALLMPGLHQTVRLFALSPMFATAMLSFAQICKFHPRTPAAVREFWAPLTQVSARNKVMQMRAHLEIAVGLSMIGGVLLMNCAPITVLLFWNFMMMRYMMSIWTVKSFRKLDGLLTSKLGKVPGVSYVYKALTSWLYSFVDPESKKAGQLCTIL
ncbi:unnamed protein product, partial [Polarella glacialis]